MVRTGLVGLFVVFFTSSLCAQSPDISKLQQQLDQSLSDSAKVTMLVDLAGRFLERGSMQQSMKLLKRARGKADSLNNAYLIQLVNASFADNYLTANKADSAIIILERTLQKYPNSSRKIDLLNFLATAYRFQADYQQSLQIYRNAMALVDSVKNPRMVSVINQNMAIVFGEVGNTASALKHHLEGLEYAEAAGDSLFLFKVLNNIGEVYNSSSQPQKAEFYLEKAVEISKKIGFKVGSFQATVNLANSMSEVGRFDEALSLYNYALTLHPQIRPDTPPFRVIYNMGDMHLRMGDLNLAEEKFHQSLEYCKELGVPQGLFFNYSGLAKVAQQRDEIQNAISFWDKALAVANDLGALSFLETATESLYQLNKEIDNYESALRYFEQFETVSDSVSHLETSQKLAETEALLQLRKQEEVNKLLQQKQDEQQARIATQDWLIAVSIAIILVSFLSLLYVYRTKIEKQRINQELEKQRNQLQQLNGVKDKILTIIAHDLRSPMASMKSMLYLLREDDLSPEDVETMRTQLEFSVTQNLTMMDNLLAWAKEQMSGLAVKIETIEAYAVVEEVFKNFEFKAREKGVLLNNEVAEELKVHADFNLLKLILRNLVTNSIKFTKAGDVISIRTKEESGQIVFEVNDTGVGISEEDQQHIFSLQGITREGTSQEKGSGLGLQLCKEFVEKQNGKIDVRSTEGEGTTFSFSLPRAS